MKTCTKCNESKSLSEFNKGSLKDGTRSMCRVCQGQAGRKYYRTSYERDPERHRNWVKAYAKRHPDRIAARSLANQCRKYGITPEEFHRMHEAQGGVCAICACEPVGERLSIDHDHDTGEVRGLLCRVCNLRLGWLEQPGRFESVLTYLGVRMTV